MAQFKPLILVFFLSVFNFFSAYAQTDHLIDDFEGGNINTWIDPPTDWEASADLPINGGFSLKHVDKGLDGTSDAAHYLKDIDLNFAGGITTWRFNMANENWDPSGSNKFWVYLIANDTDFNGGLTDGYAVGVNLTGSSDLLTLWKVTNGAADGTVVESVFDWNANTTAGIEVTRDENGLWELKFDDNGNFDNLQSAGAAVNTDYSGPEFAFFGPVFTYTASRAGEFRTDDVSVKNSVTINPTPPSVTQLSLFSSKEIDLTFNEPIDPATATDVNNYTADNGLGIPDVVTQLGFNSVRVKFLIDFQNGTENTVTVSNVEDFGGTAMAQPQDLKFTFFTEVVPGFNDLVINEIFPDPDPNQSNMPNSEFVELYNTTEGIIKLNGFKFSDGNSIAVLPDVNIFPNDYVIIVPAGSENLFIPKYGDGADVIGVNNFPGLNNDGDVLTLKDAGNNLLFVVEYSDEWYQDAFKEKGGYTLEMIDPTGNPCGEELNWRASNATDGGTPNSQNSIFAAQPDIVQPKLLTAVAQSPTLVKLTFNEKVDPVTAGIPANYSVDNGIGVIAAVVGNPGLKSVTLTLDQGITVGTVYTATVAQGLVVDCKNNAVNTNNTAKFALPEPGIAGDIIINEILFNPLSGGFDFVEIYNKSDKNISLENWKVANFDDQDIIIQEPFVIFPNEYIVLTENGNTVKAQYPKAKVDNFPDMSGLPSFNDDDGTVIIKNNLNDTIDRFDYDEDFHFPLVDNPEGVSLERIGFNVPTNTQESWFSAAASEGFATPGFRNSQFFEGEVPGGTVTVAPQVFTPDQDGFNDFVEINFDFGNTGNTATVTIYDAAGRAVRQIASNQTLGTDGFFIWDGTRDDGGKARVGPYLVYVEVFNTLTGNVESFKEKVVVGALF